MKKVIFILSVCLTMLQSTARDGKLEIGVMVAPSLVQLYGNSLFYHYNTPTIGFSAGVSVQYNFNKIIGLHTDLLYETKGYATTVQLTDEQGNALGTTRAKIYIDYLSIPVMARVTLGKKVKFFIDAGPYLGIYIQNRAYSSYSPHYHFSTGLAIKPIDAGAALGLGVSIPIANSFSINVEARDHIGILNIPENGTLKTNAASLFLGFVYTIK